MELELISDIQKIFHCVYYCYETFLDEFFTPFGGAI